MIYRFTFSALILAALAVWPAFANPLADDLSPIDRAFRDAYLREAKTPTRKPDDSTKLAWLIQKAGCTGYTGPGDLKAFTAWFGLRAYSCAVAKPGTNLMLNARNNSTAEVCDFLINTSGGVGNTTNCTGASNGVSALTFCGTGSNCRVTILYDQTKNNACGGASCDFVQATSGDQPQFPGTGFNNINFPGTGADSITSANNYTPSSAVISVVATAKREANSNTVTMLTNVGSGNGIRGKNLSTGQWELFTSGGTITVNSGTGDTPYHAGAGVFNGASSFLNVDGVSQTGTLTASTTGAAPSSLIASNATMRLKEIGWIDNVALTTQEAQDLVDDSRNYWGF